MPHSARNAVNFLTPLHSSQQFFYTTLLDPKIFHTLPLTQSSCGAEQKIFLLINCLRSFFYSSSKLTVNVVKNIFSYKNTSLDVYYQKCNIMLQDTVSQTFHRFDIIIKCELL